jgi:hypothetical protein
MPVTISVSHDGRERPLPEVADPVREVSGLLRAYAHASGCDRLDQAPE